MRIFTRTDTLFIRGNFKAASTGIFGGIRLVTTLLNHTVPHDFSAPPERFVSELAIRNGFDPAKTFGLLTAVPMKYLCIMQIESVTVCITAGVTHPDGNEHGTINIIVVADTPLSDAALLDAIITTTEAKAQAMRQRGYDACGTLTDAVIIASSVSDKTVAPGTYAGSKTRIGSRIDTAVRFGVTTALERFEGGDISAQPAYFIYSSIGGGHWFLWNRKSCQYYPCHFAGQRCDYCYCPLYPCKDESLGDWIVSISGKNRVWSCARCILNHQPVVVDHLKQFPEADILELKHLLLMHHLPMRQGKNNNSQENDHSS